MTVDKAVRRRAEGCLLGLACGDALGRPVEFMDAETIRETHGEVTEMLADGTHGQPAGTVTDDTELALCIAESLVDRGGFDGADVARRFVEWLALDPFDIGLTTRDLISRLWEGVSWERAGVEVWRSRPEGSNAGNGSAMRCVPYGIAFRHFDAELTAVSRQSSAITHADPRCQWGCVLLNRTIAGLILGENDPLGAALTGARAVPEELRAAIVPVQAVLDGERSGEDLEPELSTGGYVVDTLQAGLYYGLTADSAERAIVDAVNAGGDTDTVGAVAGAVAGARFGVDYLPGRWLAAIDEIDRIRILARELTRIRQPVSEQNYRVGDDGDPSFKGRTVQGPAVIPAREFQEATIGHRPHPAPHRVVREEYHDLTPTTAAMVDWERRAYATHRDRRDVDVDLGDLPGENGGTSSLVRVPEYSFADAFEVLPEADRERIERDATEAAAAFVRAYAAFARVRTTMIDADVNGIERVDPMIAATRVLVGSFDEFADMLLSGSVGGGYASPEEVTAALDPAAAEETIASQPWAVTEAATILADLASGAAAILDYVTHFRPPSDTGVDEESGDDPVAELRAGARTMVGELQVACTALRRAALRHPEVDFEEWQQTSNGHGSTSDPEVDKA